MVVSSVLRDQRLLIDGSWSLSIDLDPTPGQQAGAPLVKQDDRLTQLYRTYGATIYWRCVRLLGNGSAAEDATQETFLRVYRHLERAPSGEEAIRWIWRIATNYCLNELRNARHRPEPVAELPEQVGEEIDLTQRDLARAVIERAPEDQRAIAWLHHVDGLDQEEVARTLGISRRTVVNKLAAFSTNARKYLARAA
jgi:RNA polymerase sigma-70 factor, ECF subfamily